MTTSNDILAFLGGTCGNNRWRDIFTQNVAERGVPADGLFNPVVADWDEAAREAEEVAKRNAKYLIFYVADPQQDGNPLSGYSMVEATMALYDHGVRAVVVFDFNGLVGHPLKAMKQAAKVLKARFPGSYIFESREEAQDWLVRELTPIERTA